MPLHAQVSGVVTDANSGLPVADAIVRLQATTTSTMTDAGGNYTLPGLAGAGLIVVAAKQGFYNAGLVVSAPMASADIVMEPVLIGFNPNYQLIDPNTCGACHVDQFDQWSGSPMGQTADNTWVYDLYNGTGTPGGMNGFVYTRDSAHLGFDPAGPCAACHQPENWVKQPGIAMEPIGSIGTNAGHGVSCETCHKVAEVDLNFVNSLGPSLPSVLFNMPFDPIQMNQVEYGALGDVTYRVDGLMRGSYQPQLVAEVCAACHQYNNDHDEDGDHEEASSPKGQATYEEWASSPYSDPQSPMFATCVDCHMPAYGGDFACVIAGNPMRASDTLRSHDIRGTTPAYLENAVDLVLNVVDNGSALAVTVDITNSMAGHSVPTGLSARNMILIVEAWRVDDGQLLTHSGTQTVDEFGGIGARGEGYYQGLAGKTFAKINNDQNGNHALIFTESDTPRFNTRIPALATDTTNYTFNVPAGSGPTKVRARLIYRRAFRSIVDAKGWTLDGKGDTLPDIMTPYWGTLMEEDDWTNGALDATVMRYGTACGGNVIDVSGNPFSANPEFGFALSGAVPNVPALLMLGFDANMLGASTLPFDLGVLGAPGCFLLTSSEFIDLAGTDSSGDALYSLPLPGGFPGGITFFAQFAVFDGTNPLGLTTTEGLQITTEP